MIDDTSPYNKIVKTIHPDGELHLIAEYPHLHNQGLWMATVEVWYQGRRVGRSGVARKTRDEAIQFCEMRSKELQVSFDPSKRISSDDLNWWAR